MYLKENLILYSFPKDCTKNIEDWLGFMKDKSYNVNPIMSNKRHENRPTNKSF